MVIQSKPITITNTRKIPPSAPRRYSLTRNNVNVSHCRQQEDKLPPVDHNTEARPLTMLASSFPPFQMFSTFEHLMWPPSPSHIYPPPPSPGFLENSNGTHCHRPEMTYAPPPVILGYQRVPPSPPLSYCSSPPLGFSSPLVDAPFPISLGSPPQPAIADLQFNFGFQSSPPPFFDGAHQTIFCPQRPLQQHASPPMFEEYWPSDYQQHFPTPVNFVARPSLFIPSDVNQMQTDPIQYGYFEVGSPQNAGEPCCMPPWRMNPMLDEVSAGAIQVVAAGNDADSIPGNPPPSEKSADNMAITTATGDVDIKKKKNRKSLTFWRKTSNSSATQRREPAEEEVPYCCFCKSNGETMRWYQSHTLKDKNGVTTKCPILRKYICPMCGATGDASHTLRYCPENPENHLKTGRARSLTFPGQKRSLLRNTVGVVGAYRYA